MIAVLWTAAALAGGLNAHGFELYGRAADPRAFVRLVAPEIAPEGLDVTMLVDHGSNPLMEDLPSGRVSVIHALTTANFGFGWSPIGSLRFDATWSAHALGTTPVGSFAGSGDARVGVTWSLARAESRRIGVALSPAVWLPTGASRYHVGAPAVAGGGVVAVGQDLGRVGWTLNAGARISPSDQERNLTVGSGPIFGAGVRALASKQFGLGLEVTALGETGFSGFPVEVTLHTHARYQPGTWLVTGLAVGLNDAVGATSWRLVVGAAMGRGGEEEVEDVPVILPPLCPGSPGCPEVEAPEVEPPDENVLAYYDHEKHKIVVVENVFFEEDSAKLLDGAPAFLEAVYQVLLEHPEVEHLLIEGHTNHHGSDMYNLRLGQVRAEAVMNWLVARGVDETRLIAKGYGYRRPLIPHDQADAARVNRRVEFTVLRPDEEPADIRIPDEGELPPW